MIQAGRTRYFARSGTRARSARRGGENKTINKTMTCDSGFRIPDFRVAQTKTNRDSLQSRNQAETQRVAVWCSMWKRRILIVVFIRLGH